MYRETRGCWRVSSVYLMPADGRCSIPWSLGMAHLASVDPHPPWLPDAVLVLAISAAAVCQLSSNEAVLPTPAPH